MKPVLLLALVVAAASILAAGCVSPGDNATQPTTIPTETVTATTGVTTAATTATGGETVTIDLTADVMTFDTETITVPAGAEVTVNFDNQDDGIPHNLAVYTDSSAAEAIFMGDTITGPAETIYTFTAPSEPGTYFFRCDVHPEMNGDFVVE